MADWLTALDPALTSRAVRASALLARAERAVRDALADAMTDYLDEVTDLVIGRDYRVPRQLVAAATPPDLDRFPPDDVWTGYVQRHVTPVTAKVFGEAFASVAGRSVLSSQAARQSYMREVHDRLTWAGWPREVFEEMRYELLEGLRNGESVNQLRDRLGAVSHIDAYSRPVRADINHWRTVRDDPASSAQERAQARRELSALWPRLDDADTAWHYFARRVARTETIAAVNGGQYAGAAARQDATGEAAFKQWLATGDARTRDSHVAANGQVRALVDPFLVGGAALQHPGEAGGPASEVINCRCTLLYLDESEALTAMAAQGTPAPIGAPS